jgi:hypothetical protein
VKSARRGNGTFLVEVSGISQHGIWLFLGDQEAFLPFEQFPWFRDAPVAGVLRVERPQPHHVYWPDLDIDLAVESILHPERFPLVSAVKPTKRSQRTRARGSKGRPRRARAKATKKAAGSRRGGPRR